MGFVGREYIFVLSAIVLCQLVVFFDVSHDRNDHKHDSKNYRYILLHFALDTSMENRPPKKIACMVQFIVANPTLPFGGGWLSAAAVTQRSCGNRVREER